MNPDRAAVIGIEEHGSATYALVLGGGGAVGVGWQIGLLEGLREAGLDLAGAKAIVGTSAGALVGALLASGREVVDALIALEALGRRIDPHRLAVGNEAFLAARRQASLGTDRQHAVRAIGRAAQEASTLPEGVYLDLFGILAGVAWPTGFLCTAVDADTADLVVWDQRSGVSLPHAVAASCSVPHLFPTVTIKGRRYMDGGILSHLNAAAAPATDVLVVVSCHPLTASVDRALTFSDVGAEAELTQLRGTRRLVAIEPDLSEIKVTPSLMMDPNLAIAARQLGKRQADHESAAVRAALASASAR
jgi:NTE family protein